MTTDTGMDATEPEDSELLDAVVKLATLWTGYEMALNKKEYLPREVQDIITPNTADILRVCAVQFGRYLGFSREEISAKARKVSEDIYAVSLGGEKPRLDA